MHVIIQAGGKGTRLESLTRQPSQMFGSGRQPPDDFLDVRGFQGRRFQCDL